MSVGSAERGPRAGAQLADALGQVSATLRRSTVQLRERGRGAGAGVIWRDDGVVVTNAHVVAGAEAEVELWDGRRLPGRVVLRDPRRDLAVLVLDTGPLPAARIGSAAALRPGELVLALGNPLGWAGALALGVVHATEPPSEMGTATPRWVRADIRLAPGNSGGPLADAHGRVVGVNTLVVNGLGYAVPSEAVEHLLRRGVPATGHGGEWGRAA